MAVVETEDRTIILRTYREIVLVVRQIGALEAETRPERPLVIRRGYKVLLQDYFGVDLCFSFSGEGSAPGSGWLGGRSQTMNSGSGTAGGNSSAPANGSSLAAGTSQATLGMGQLNLGNLGVNPALLATAQAALLSALTQAQHQQPNMQPDINALLSQYSNQLASGQQPSVGGSYGSNMGTPSGYWNPQRTDSPTVDHVIGSGPSHTMSHHPYQRHSKKPRDYYGN